MEIIYIVVAFVILYLGVLLSIFYFLKWLFTRNWTDRGIWTTIISVIVVVIGTYIFSIYFSNVKDRIGETIVDNGTYTITFVGLLPLETNKVGENYRSDIFINDIPIAETKVTLENIGRDQKVRFWIKTQELDKYTDVVILDEWQPLQKLMNDQEFSWITTLTENNGPYQGNQAELSYDFTIKREVGNIETLKFILRID